MYGNALLPKFVMASGIMWILPPFPIPVMVIISMHKVKGL